ncbi:olfactory receptor 2M2-like [Ambystoma mexicanum]|uniref:olfactory receptor 2M2-like n=1 Tax=Ambystoma mexicanum TaxID=8296 RepID=UPI0037E78390
MAYDRYVAICHPLRYTSIMNMNICFLLAALSWLPAPLANIINHFFCDLMAVLRLSCSDLYMLEMVIFSLGIPMALSPVVLTITSYTYIILVIMRINSTEGKYKTFSTCSSHLIVVSKFFGAVSCVHLRPVSMYSPATGKLFALLYTSFIPMLNPLIYSRRNRDMHLALKKVAGRKQSKTGYYLKN